MADQNATTRTCGSAISIVKAGEEDQFVFSLCGDASCNGEGFHCPLCKDDFHVKALAKAKAHFKEVHLSKAISHQGFTILRCRKSCCFKSSCGEKSFDGKPHWHCPHCKNGFPREGEMTRHLKLHQLNAKQGGAIGTCSSPSGIRSSNQDATNIPLSELPDSCEEGLLNIQADRRLVARSRKRTAGDTSVDSEVHCSRNKRATEEGSVGPVETVEDCFDDLTAHFVVPTHGIQLRKSSEDKVSCPECSKSFHPNALSLHVRTQHQCPSLGTHISNEHFLRGVCVDTVNGLFLVRKSFSGSDHVVHVQFKTSSPQKFCCTSKSCNQLSETAARSEKAHFMCKHLRSVEYAAAFPKVAVLREAKLQQLISEFRWLKPERKEQCMALQSDAATLNVPLAVCLPILQTDSSRYRHFSVYAGDCQSQTLVNRVIVTCDTETLHFTGKCCGGGFCVHKNVAKWYIQQHEPALLQPLLPGGSVVGQVQQAPSSTIVYPPLDVEVNKKMTAYLYEKKRIPPYLPAELTVNHNMQYKTSYIPVETACTICDSVLSDPVRCTDKAKLLTMSGLIEGLIITDLL